MHRALTFATGLIALIFSASLPARQTPTPPAVDWAGWVESDVPFFSSIVDARQAGSGLPSDNLAPRALVLRLGADQWAAFDVDLLRVVAMWRGPGVTPTALAPGSYHHPDRKTPGGQTRLPAPDGTVAVATGIYPGWQGGAEVALNDPREPAPSPEEVGRGPLPDALGRFTAIRQIADGGAVLEYAAAGANIRERMAGAASEAGWSLSRQFDVAPSSRQLWLVLGSTADGVSVSLSTASGNGAPAVSLEKVAPAGAGLREVWVVRVPPHSASIGFAARFAGGSTAPSTATVQPIPDLPPARRWRQEVTTGITRASSHEAYVVDDVALPTENPWRRNVRLSDIQFLKDGTGVGITIDGDVWIIRGLSDASGRVRWTRFASGLHEPLTLAIRDDEIFAFDRNGIWRLRDTNGDGEADVHELFSNAFAQTADLREFPSTIRLAPGGEFVIAKGGQEATTQGKHNGSVLRISADGRRATLLGHGFRQPNIAVNLRTGLVTASDQQGNYIPSTPLHIVRDAQFYGFLGDKRPREVYPAPIAEPLTWVPHAANASAMSQVWLFGARMGPLTDALVYFGFNNPELFRVLLDEAGARPQAAVVSITRAFEFPPLHGSVNPADGQLYVAGFQVLGWGTTATRLSGLGRVRYTGAVSTLPRALEPKAEGVLLRFDERVDPVRAANPDSYAVASWHYKRTYEYGSPQFRADGTVGIDRLAPSSALVSEDQKSVFVAVPGMTPVMQMRLGWSLTTVGGEAFQDTAYFTPYSLPRFDSRKEGFADVVVDLKPRALALDPAAPVSAAEGRRLYQAYGCVACHATEETPLAKLGPSWKGLYGRQRTFAGGVVRTVADEVYLRESILQPSAKIVSGYERGDVSMPSYAGVLSAPQVESLVAYIRSLQ